MFVYIIIIVLALVISFIPNFSILVITGIFIYGFIQLFKTNSETEQSESDFEKLVKFKIMKNNYMKSQQWDIKRKKCLKRDNYTCQSCYKQTKLSVHHLAGYNKIPNEPITNLISICDSCHKFQHKMYGYPSTYQEYMKWNVILLKS